MLIQFPSIEISFDIFYGFIIGIFATLMVISLIRVIKENSK